MSKYKLLLFGISGDLAMRKVLPSLGQLIETDINNQYSLIGYSRSNVELEKVQNAITSKQKSSKLCNIILKNGEYDDPKIFYESIKNLETDERLFVYLALPPVTFFQSIQNFCPYSEYPINIILEKPYATSLEESKKLTQLINICDLQIKIHFFDHYLFKQGLVIPLPIKKYIIKEKSQLKTVHIKAVESLGLENRAGYYDTTGAVQDMLPHLLSLWDQYSSQLDYKNCHDLENYAITNVIYDQYPEYKNELGKESKTETYFKITIYDSLNKLNLIFESGKKQIKKETFISFLDNKDNLIANINLYPEVSFYPEIKDITETNETNKLEPKKYDEHVEMFKDLENNNFNKFLEPSKVIWQWEIIQKARNQSDVF